jgi:hypothetical protein
MIQTDNRSNPSLPPSEEEAERFGRPVLIAHGDEHTYRIDHPLWRSATNRPLENVTRLEVPGSPSGLSTSRRHTRCRESFRIRASHGLPLEVLVVWGDIQESARFKLRITHAEISLGHRTPARY